MLDPEMITALVDEAVKVYKKANSESGKKKNLLPEYNPIYCESVKLDDRVAVHAEIEHFPKELFTAKAPNETDAERKYREESYQAETLPLWNRALSNTNRIFNDQNYSIDWKEKDSPEASEHRLYFEKEYPLYANLITYFDSVVRPRKVNYPNSLICFKPRNIPFEIIEVEDSKKKEYQWRIKDNELLEPVAVIYPSRQIIQFKPGEYALILLNEKSWIKDGSSKPVKEGLIFELYDKDAIYRIEQYGEKSKWLFETYLYYQHDWDKLPATKLKGQPIDKDGDVLYKSHFYDAVPPLNQALYDSSTLQVSKVANVFLEKWEYAEQCDAEGCIDGNVTSYGDDDKSSVSRCTACKGSGWKRNGVLGVYSLRLPDRMNPTEAQTPPAGYIQKNTEVLTFLREEIKYNERKSFLFLGVDVSDSEVKGTDTALGKMIDREALFSALKVISGEIFDLLEFAISAIGYMRYGKPFKAPHINRPTTFAIRTYQDLTIEIAEAIKAGLPEIAIRELIKEYLQTRFSSNADKTQAAALVSAADDLQMMPQVEIASRVMTGTVAKWQDVLHVNIYRFIEEEISANEKWMDQDMTVKVKVLQDKAKALALEIAPKQNSPDDIMKGIAGGA